jgi:hypothetical protein
MAERDFGKGKGISIAQIDSGINEWHPHTGKIAGGAAFQVDAGGRILLTCDHTDQLGHGTAVAGVLNEQVPEAELWSLKIFHDTLTAHIEVLCAAIEWCIEAKIDFINLSLGVRRDIGEFQQVCAQAAAAGVIIVAACDEQNGLLWPGCYDSAFGVKAARQCTGELFFYNPDEPVSFLASGLPRRLEGPMQKFNFQGHSFAAAHVTGLLAKLKEKFGVGSKQQMEACLLGLFGPVPVESG